MTQQNYLTITNIHKSFGTTKVLKNINLSCNQGELICLLGPSGCGKTTLLRIVAGLEQQNSGTLSQDGKDISHLATKDRDFGIVFQSYALFPNLTVTQNIGYGIAKLKDKNARIAELMELVGLSEHANKYPAQLSGGQQQRVALARALAIKPNLLLLDEPLSALDANVREHLRQEIKQLQQKIGVTTLMVTHDQEEAMSMADRIVVMNAGRIEQIGSPQEIYNTPQTKFVANFVGTMNFFDATVTSDSTVHFLGKEFNHVSNVTNTIKSATKSKTSTDKQEVGIRPENITFVFDDIQQADALVTISKIEYLGQFVRVYTQVAQESALESSDTQEIIVDVRANEFATMNLQIGTTAQIAINAHSIQIFTSEV